MSTTEKLNAIRARCVELLALAEKRTRGKWQADPEEGVYNASVRCGISEPWTGDCVASVLKETDAAYIAACAGAAEAGCRNTADEIEALLRILQGGFDAMLNNYAISRAASIIADWEDEQ